jgi:acyl-CoA thioesterase-1
MITLGRLFLTGFLLSAAGCGGGSSPIFPAASTGPQSTAPWLAFGDSITQLAFQAPPTAWASVLGASAPPIINAGVRGDTSLDALKRVDALLASVPRVSIVGVAFGTNDAYGVTSPADFETTMREIIRRIVASGKTPLIASIPYSPVTRMARLPAFNQAIASINSANRLIPGPDLYTWFQTHPEQLQADGIHPTDEGDQAIQRLWATVNTLVGSP